MQVFVVAYKGTDTDDILGVYKNLAQAKKAMYYDYFDTEFCNELAKKELEDSRIYVETEGERFDEWYIHETELR